MHSPKKAKYEILIRQDTPHNANPSVAIRSIPVQKPY
nr:MAG TPA: hypothetical protein [Caudoviricetes sp.]